jgi:hypothetical protein
MFATILELDEHICIMQVNNYQTIVVSDVLHTYVIFSYMCGEVQWSALGRNRAAVVGFNAEGNFFGNHPLSGFPAVGDAVSCTFELGKRRRKRQDAEMPPANMLMELPADPELRVKVESCLNAFDFDSGLLLLGTTPEQLAMMLESLPCPCSRGQASNDYGRFIPQKGAPQCYVSTEPVRLRLLVSDVTLTQQCCYDANGYVITIVELV